MTLGLNPLYAHYPLYAIYALYALYNALYKALYSLSGHILTHPDT